MTEGPEALKEAIEELSQAEHTEIDLKHRVIELVQDSNIEAINDLPLLYRMEIKRVLDEENNHDLASQIKA